MHRSIRNILAGIAIMGMGSACILDDDMESFAEIEQSLASDEAANSWIVTLKDGVSAKQRANEMAALHGVAIKHVYNHALNGFAFKGSATAAERIARNPDVAMIEPDGVVHILGKVDEHQDGTVTPYAQTTPWGITRVGGAGNGVGKTAWVIDTGIDFNHSDLNVDVGRSANFVTKGRNTADDGNGHGTHVAGTIGAINNSQDVVGVAAGATLVAVRVLDNSGSGTWSGVIAGVDYVAANGKSGDVANMSLGGSGSNSSLENAVKNAASKGIKFVLAAGNSGANAANFTPARVNGNNIYTVSAIGTNDCLTSWSNWGNPPVDYAAPGASILSTKKGGGTTTMSGTSMAAPHVAGILLLGSVRTSGHACNDPDGNADPIASR